MAGPLATARDIRKRCLDQGFAAVGVCGVEPSERMDAFRDWLRAGKQGELAYLEEHLDVRADPSKITEGAKSIVMVADLYATRADNIDSEPDPDEPASGRVARYARGRDYHLVIKKRLHAVADRLRIDYPGSEFRTFVDTAPVMERELAVRCGLGWIGKHTLTIHPRHGSYFLLGGFATTLELHAPPEQRVIQDHCGSCTRCIEACPTGAITPYSVDARRCISYMTIEHRGVIDERYRDAVGDWLFGCDICQEVCPHNSPREFQKLTVRGRTVREEYTRHKGRFDLLTVLNWTNEERVEATPASPMKRAKLELLQRNAAVCARNAPEPGDALVRRLDELAADQDAPELVRDAAAGR